MQKLYDFLRRHYNLQVDASYYDHISLWMDWWRGLHAPFHRFAEPDTSGNLVQREMFTLKMAKKCCEDWASLLLNERTRLSSPHSDVQHFLLGLDGQPGFLQHIQFWRRLNALVELAFASGTGAARLRFSHRSSLDPPQLYLDFLHAPSILPISFDDHSISEVAFLSQICQNGLPLYYLEVHLLRDGLYEVHNHFFRSLNGSLQETLPPPGVLPIWRTDSTVPLFALLSPNLVNHVNLHSPLGVSVFANAIDNLKGIDLAFHNFCRDFKLGGKKVFLNKSLTLSTTSGLRLTPDDVSQQLFTVLGDNDFDDTRPLIQEFNPSLRVSDNIDGLQGMLDAFSLKVGFGAKMYQFRRDSVSTATQYMGDRQELIQHRAKHLLSVEAFLHSLLRSLLHYACSLGLLPLSQDLSPSNLPPLHISFPDDLFWPAASASDA